MELVLVKARCDVKKGEVYRIPLTITWVSFSVLFLLLFFWCSFLCFEWQISIKFFKRIKVSAFIVNRTDKTQKIGT